MSSEIRTFKIRDSSVREDELALGEFLRTVEVSKIASDLRLLSMGPRAGLAEIKLPAVQPGSSIMPGKVNPSVPEMVNQVCHQVYGCDATILAAADGGQFAESRATRPVPPSGPRSGQALRLRPVLSLRAAALRAGRLWITDY